MSRALRRVRRVAAMAAMAAVFVACSSGGTGGGANQATTFVDIHGLGVDSSGTLFVATHRGLIRHASDGGWIYTGSDRSDHMGFSLDPATGAMYRSGHPASGSNLGVDGSRDGATWTHLSDVLDQPVDFHAMGVSFVDGKTLYGWGYGAGTLRSSDGGQTWQPIDARAVGDQIYSLAGTGQAGEVLAGGPQGMFRSSDGGATWSPVPGPSGGTTIAIGPDPKKVGRMLVSTQQGVKATLDGGKTWTDAGAGISADAQVRSIAISPVDANTAYAAAGTTIFMTKDGGKTWTTLRAGS